MESKIHTSFIPDKMPNVPKNSTATINTSGGSGANLFMVLAIIVFAVTLALSAGVFLYDRYITASATTKSEQLQRERQLLEPATIRELMRLDERLKIANQVLSGHVAPSILFGLLEELTLKSVYFENMDYSIGKEGDAIVKMKGHARSVNGVALQADFFGKNRAFINPIFSDLNLVPGGVDFQVTTSVDIESLRYLSVAGTYGVEEYSGEEDISNNNF